MRAKTRVRLAKKEKKAENEATVTIKGTKSEWNERARLPADGEGTRAKFSKNGLRFHDRPAFLQPAPTSSVAMKILGAAITRINRVCYLIKRLTIGFSRLVPSGPERYLLNLRAE